MNAINKLNKIQNSINTSINRIATGSKNTMSNNSDYAISQKMRYHLSGVNQHISNVQNTNALVKTASETINNSVSILSSLKEYLLNAKNDTNNESDLNNIQKNIDQSIQQIDDNSKITFNNQSIFGNDFNGVYINDISLKSLGLTDGENTLINTNNINESIERLDSAINGLNGVLDTTTTLGSQQDKLEFQTNNLTSIQENLYNSLFTIDDTDLAKEVMNLKSNQAQEQLALFGLYMYQIVH